ncbi:Protein kinase domain containing protein [Reticulomyxa filosa]|uniref:Protein kinase domain containing protein n=1 Tax=Reticulomyxa filosa TaxID=46433 RepID=X6P1W2_RETFI|nr:Protein kinase domain containing protein [Reticulomyxa filosa]|eukprot:ETO32128.1 Protein kinase domain containing protein [Reticulomyxa filosa]
MSKKRDMRETEVAKIMKQMLEGVQFLHTNFIAHLDLKPNNVMFASKAADAPVQLVDFGMSHGVPRLTKIKGLVGTAHFVAPEVIHGEYDAAADVWSCGVILYYMMFGYPPFFDDKESKELSDFATSGRIFAKICKGFNPIQKEGLGPWFPANRVVSQDVRDLISKMLTKSVKDRITVREALDHPWFKTASDKTLDFTIHDALTKFSNQCKFRVLISQIMAHQLPTAEYKRVEAWFREFDENKDNKLSLPEFKKAMNSYKLGYSERDLECMFQSIDLDNSKEIDFEELLTAFAFQRLVATDERLYQTFRALDIDSDGFITKKELQDKILQLEEEETRTNNKARKLLGLEGNLKGNEEEKALPRVQVTRTETAVDWADIDLDGKINYEEFLAALHPDFNEPVIPRPVTPSKSDSESAYLKIAWVSHSNVVDLSTTSRGRFFFDSETETETETEQESGSDEEVAFDDEEDEKKAKVVDQNFEEDDDDVCEVQGMFNMF